MGNGAAFITGWSVAVFNLDAGGDLCYFRSRFSCTILSELLATNRLHTVRSCARLQEESDVDRLQDRLDDVPLERPWSSSGTLTFLQQTMPQ